MSQKAVHPWRRTWLDENAVRRRDDKAKRQARKAKVRDKHAAILPDPQPE